MAKPEDIDLAAQLKAQRERYAGGNPLKDQLQAQRERRTAEKLQPEPEPVPEPLPEPSPDPNSQWDGMRDGGIMINPYKRTLHRGRRTRTDP